MDRFPYRYVPTSNICGSKHLTPSIFEQLVVNPNIDDNRCLQRFLILASEGRHKIITNRKIDDESVYNKWWKQPNKYKVFGLTIHKIEEAMNICDNRAFDQSEEKSSRLEELLKVSLNVFEITLLPGYNDYSKDKNKHFVSSQIYSGHKSTSLLSLCILNHTRPMVPEDSNTIPNHFLYIKDLTIFKQ